VSEPEPAAQPSESLLWNMCRAIADYVAKDKRHEAIELLRGYVNEPEPIYIAPRPGDLVQIYVPVFRATEGQKSWLKGHGYKEITVSQADLQELLRKARA
jgi:hypothetical protein